MNRRIHNRSPHWSQAYRRRVADRRRMARLLVEFYERGVMTLNEARVAYGLSSPAFDFTPLATIDPLPARLVWYGPLTTSRKPMRLSNITVC